MRILDNNPDRLADLMKALSDATRLRILNLLIERECCVCEVMQALSISQTRASRNLSQLYDAGLLAQRREGLWTIYYLSPEAAADHRGLIIQAVEEALKDNDQAAADRRRLRESARLCPPADLPGLGTSNHPDIEEPACPVSSGTDSGQASIKGVI
ncbi:metalloregulator ArsR/SmtB family transcription factor [Dehalogenimonas sp. THU2]|uniref:ArsR/SmtB family transcription factor n=1 Tax=Dehalogenimonas sp. THU2 TaxID=3151121 RepID=UPI003218945F